MKLRTFFPCLPLTFISPLPALEMKVNFEGGWLPRYEMTIDCTAGRLTYTQPSQGTIAAISIEQKIDQPELSEKFIRELSAPLKPQKDQPNPADDAPFYRVLIKDEKTKLDLNLLIAPETAPASFTFRDQAALTRELETLKAMRAAEDLILLVKTIEGFRESLLANSDQRDKKQKDAER